MKLIAENEMGNLTLITEADDADGKRSMYIEGIFAQAEKVNRNNRIYPKDVLESAIDTYIKDYVNTKRSIGELNHPNCVLSNDFRVLQPTGWIEFNDINVGDEIIGMTESGEKTTGYVLRKIEQPFVTEECYHFCGKHIDIEVTENHRFYCLDRNNSIVVKTAKELYENSSEMSIIKTFGNYESKSGIHLDRRFVKIEKFQKDLGIAYCLETTTGNFYIEHKGNQFLTGNSFAPNPERACILINELKWDGNNVLGKAKVLSTPQGEIVKSLLKDGVQLGVSTRGMGTLEEDDDKSSIVKDDYVISAIDVVSNPSGMDCWVNGVLENVEFYYKNGVLCECSTEEYLKHRKTANIKVLKRDFKKFLQGLNI